MILYPNFSTIFLLKFLIALLELLEIQILMIADELFLIQDNTNEIIKTYDFHAKFINCTQIKKKVTSRNVPRNCLPS